MPARSEKLLRLKEEAGPYELPYVSKSRVMQWIKNPEHFRLKYLEGVKEPETFAMRRGTNIHETFEHYYNECLDKEYYAGLQVDGALPDDREMWADFIEPHISNFFNWEESRWQASGEQCKYYLPKGVEEEHWRDPILGIDGEPEWMGIADAVLPASGVPGVPDSDGVVIVDFKTGKVPDKKYRNNGILNELAYYSILFEDKYDVVASAAYYPKKDVLLTQEDDSDRRDAVREAAADMINACIGYEGDTQFEIDQGPLCGWGECDDERSSLYGVCSQCNWNKPVDRKNEFLQLIEEGYSDRDIAGHFGCSTNASSYWRYKLS